jgi:hypothetical protein
MTDDVKGFIGLGFSIDELDPEDYAEFPCSMHKLDEERDPHPCPEEPFVFFGLDGTEWDICLCKRHFALFASDIIAAANHFGEKAGGVAEPSKLIIREGGAMTYSGMVELIMETKDKLHGNA